MNLLFIALVLLTACISPSYHRRKIRELQENIASRDKDVVKVNDPDLYLCECGRFHHEFK